MKNTRWIKVMALVLAMLMLLPMALACKKEEAEEETSAVTTTDNGDSLYDENGYLKDSLPDLDYKKRVVNILGWDNTWTPVDYWVETDTGDTVDDAIYFRNKKVEERLNISLWNTSIDGGNYTYESFIEVLSQSIQAGAQEYDLVAEYSWAGGAMATQGLCLNMKNLEYLDFDKPWWSKTFVETSTFDGKLYFATGELAKSYLYAMHCLFLNKTMLAELKLEDPRQMVLDGTWTYDKLYKLTENVGANGDNDSEKSSGDRFGFLTWNDTAADAFVVSAGINMAEFDSNGVLKLTDDFLGDKTDKLITDLVDRFHHTIDWGIEVGGTMPSWENIVAGKTLLGTVELGQCSAFAEQENWAFGVLPLPMWDTDQGRYYTNLDFDFTFFSVPMDAADPDMSSAVLECMNSEAYRSSSPTYFETVMKGRYAQDELDPQMFDKIKENIIVDVNRVFNGQFEWSNSAVARFRRAVSNDSSGWISNIGGVKDSINGILAGIGESLMDPTA